MTIIDNAPAEIFMNAQSKIERLPKLFRIAGSLLLLTAATIFMLQEWAGMGHVTKYYSFLALTLLLSGCGVFCGMRMKDDKGARTFLALAAAIVPVHFCQLGGFIYSRFVDPLTLKLPAYALWIAQDTFSAVVTPLIGIACLIPVVLLSFSALARESSRRATALFFLFNCALLLPTRDPTLIGILTLALSIMIIAADLYYLYFRSELRTTEGTFIRAMIASPFFVLLGRTLTLYNPTSWFHACLLASAAVVLFAGVAQYISSQKIIARSQLAALVPAFFSWHILAGEIYDIYYPFFYKSSVILYGFPFAALMLASSFFYRGSKFNYRNVACFMMLVTLFAQLMANATFPIAFLAIVVGLAVLTYCYLTNQFFNGISAASVLVFGLVHNVHLALKWADFSPWISLAALGVGVIFLSTFLERGFPLFITKLRRFKLSTGALLRT